MMAIISSAGRAPPSCLLAPRTAHLGVASYSLTETAQEEFSDDEMDSLATSIGICVPRVAQTETLVPEGSPT